ncbi:MAG TPA: alpha-ketoglutarate-dependent dioxygenase AlkB [Burkholderiales bacterium]|jgi:alkylated DNA repair dioxygenase AlkB|nr:alpha-ketoglutarate-dependent dioxygenase AlkB [Burkholderiales bacterium]
MPAGLLYEPDFISPGEEAALLAAIRGLPLEEAKYKSYTARRRTASFGSSYDFDTNVLGPAPDIPAFLIPLREKIAQTIQFPAERFEHALVTEYRPGTPLGWHRDVPEFEAIAGVSLAGRCRMRFRPYPPQPRARVFVLELEPRSIYLLRDEIRWRWQHSVAPTRELRYSVTFRTLSER